MAIATRPDQFTTITVLEGLRFDPRSDLRKLDLTFEQLAPPTHLWVTPDDIIEVGIRNSLAGVTVRLSAKVLIADGTLAIIQQDITPASDRSLNYTPVRMSYGYLLAAAAYAVGSTSPKRGQTYVALQLVRPPTASFVTVQPMGADYVAGSNFVGWPGGRIVGATEGTGFMRAILITNPAPGVDLAQTIPTNGRWRILGLRASLTTGAAVPARTVLIEITSPPIVVMVATSPVNQGANSTMRYELQAGYSFDTQPANVPGLFLPDQLSLPAGYNIITVTANLAAADQWTNIVLFVEEWIED